MNLIKFALRRPITIMVAVFAIGYFSFISLRKIKVDIFPEIDLPAIYIAMPYGGLTPSYMDGFMANEFQKVLVFVSGVKDIDFKSVQGFTLMKLSFYPGTDMSQAASEVSNMVSRAMGFLPPGAVPPQVVRFDGSSQPVGQLVFESPHRTITELQNLALTRIRPMLVNVEGITAPAPFGGNARTMVVKVDPDLMQSYKLSAEEVTLAITRNNIPSPAGNIRIGDMNLMAPVNSLVRGPEEFLNIPIRTGNGPSVYVKDIASVEDAADVTVGYAVINGKRAVYLPVIKKADASTLRAVTNIKNAISVMEKALPPDVKINFVFDQSGYISSSLNNLMHEGLLGALLTGLMVLLFLGDKRGALIVVLTIPIAIFSAVIMLYLFNQSINIMTLSGLALAIGILVDEATVTIENIHQHFELKKTKQRAILDALQEISTAKLLILFCILAVLTPTFMMSGIPRDMFLPLSLAVAFAMIASFLASQTFVPILANWLMKPHESEQAENKTTRFDKFRQKHLVSIEKTHKHRSAIIVIYGLAVTMMIGAGFWLIGTDILPLSNSADVQLRITAPAGSRIEKTEQYLKRVTSIIREQLPEKALKISSSYIGMQPSATAINPIFLFTRGSQEAVLQFSIDQEIYKGSIAEVQENVRKAVKGQLPEIKLTFEPMELVQKIMSDGATTPVQIKIAGRQLNQVKKYASKIESELKRTHFLRDIRIAEPLDYPSLQIEVDREKAGQFGLNMTDVSRVLTMATSSTRFTNKNLWVDPKSGLVFQTQVQFPESEIQSIEKLRNLPLKAGELRPVLEDVATVKLTSIPGQVNRKGPNRYVTVQANLYKKDLGSAAKAVKKALHNVGEPPRGILVNSEGTLQLLDETLNNLQTGLAVAVIVILLMLTAYYQSFRVSLVILSVVPAVIGGSLLTLLLFRSTLNLQSYMGIIMSVGVSISNAVLLINQAEFYRVAKGMSAKAASLMAVSSRLRPILMTSLAMVAGMVPMAAGFGDGGEQVAPLGQAVIGGLLFSTLASLLFLPHLFALIQRNTSRTSKTLDPDDPENVSAILENATTVQF